MKKIVIALSVLVISAAIGAAVVIAKESDLAKKTEESAEKPAAANENKAPEQAEPKADNAAAADEKFMPPLPFTPTKFEGSAYEAVSDNSDLSTFMTALNKSGLAEELKGKGPITVFAPNNEAFTKLPEGFLDTIMAEDGNEILKSILSYHIVPGKILSVHLLREETGVASLKGKPIALKRTPEGILFNSSLVTKTDIETTNGVIHIVDSIDLNPQAMMVVAEPTEAPAGEANKAEEETGAPETEPSAEKPAE